MNFPSFQVFTENTAMQKAFIYLFPLVPKTTMYFNISTNLRVDCNRAIVNLMHVWVSIALIALRRLSFACLPANHLQIRAKV